MGSLSPWHWAIIVVVAFALFGYKKLPDATRSVGRSLRIFKSEMKDLVHDEDDPDKKPAQIEGSTPAQPVSQQPVAQTAIQQPVAATQPVAQPGARPSAQPLPEQQVMQPVPDAPVTVSPPVDPHQPKTGQVNGTEHS